MGPVDRGILAFFFTFLCFFFRLSGVCAEQLVYIRCAHTVENPLQSAGLLGLIAVAADRFSSSMNVGVCLRKLRCRRSLVSVIGSVDIDRGGIFSYLPVISYNGGDLRKTALPGATTQSIVDRVYAQYDDRLSLRLLNDETNRSQSGDL